MNYIVTHYFQQFCLISSKLKKNYYRYYCLHISDTKLKAKKEILNNLEMSINTLFIQN